MHFKTNNNHPRERIAKRGFTLAELMVVIVMIAILAAILIPASVVTKRKTEVDESRDTSRRAEAIQETTGASGLLFDIGTNDNFKPYASFETEPDFERIDAHIHIYSLKPEFRDVLDKLNIGIVDICVMDNFNTNFIKLPLQESRAQALAQFTGGRVAWCAGFDPTGWEEPGFAERAIEHLRDAFAHGAVAVKFYKDIGMLLKSKDGKYLMPDDPVFDPIFDFIAKNNKTVYNHIADPWASWRPPDPKGLHYRYYKNTPFEYMYLHPERPSKETILAARDRMVQNHPNVRFVCCHLGAMEEDVDDMAKHFDQYPNMAVDTAGWVKDLMNQDSDKVRAFLIKYQDRVLYGTDRLLLDSDDGKTFADALETWYAREWHYFAGSDTIHYMGITTKGLHLPKSVLKKIFHDNAVNWVPGVPDR